MYSTSEHTSMDLTGGKKAGPVHSVHTFVLTLMAPSEEREFLSFLARGAPAELPDLDSAPQDLTVLPENLRSVYIYIHLYVDKTV